MTVLTQTPSLLIYNQMQQAFDHFNERLFGKRLPQVILSLHRHPNTIGYFIESKYRARDTLALGFDQTPEELDEIALNPDMLMVRTDFETLSTMAHEQCHLWVAHFSIAPRRGHHCKRWAAKMKEIGLHPSSTSMPGGKETGSKVSHYIVKGGAFEGYANDLLATGFKFAWGSVAGPPNASKAGKRTKYVCAGCGAAVWGKEGLNIDCGDCSETFLSD